MTFQKTIWLALILWVNLQTSYAKGFDLEPPPLPDTNFEVPRPDEPDPSQIPDYISSPNREKHGKFLADVMTIILESGVFFNDKRQVSPLQWNSPDDLKKLFDFTVGEKGVDHSKLLQIIRDVIKFSPLPSHPFMLDKRVAGLDPYALLGDWVATTMSNNVVIYQIAPVFTLMEIDIAKKLGERIGWDDPEGVPTTGAGVANSLAVAVALQKMYPELKEGGFPFYNYPSPVIFISEDASYAFRKAALYQGIAERSIVKVKVNPKNGRMDIEDLKRRITDAKHPAHPNDLVAVVATVGTPLFGAIDPIDEIAGICEEHGMWLHVDAEKGSGVFFGGGEQMEKLRKDISRADSVTFGTWAFAMPYVTTFLLTKEHERLQHSFGLHAAYVFTGLDLYNGSYDTGDHTVQTSRRPEVAKLWFSWKARGNSGYTQLVDLQYNNLKAFTELVKGDKAFKLVFDEFEIPQVALWWVPSAYREIDWLGQGLWQSIGAATQLIKRKLVQNNVIQVSLGHGGHRRPDFLIISLTNSVLTKNDFQYILDVIKKYGAEAAGEANLPMPSIPQGSEKHAWGTAPYLDLHGKLYEDVFQLLLKEGLFFLRNDFPSKFEQPEKLPSLMDLELEDQAATHENLYKIIKDIVNYSPHWGQAYFIYQLAAGLDPYTIAADYVVPALNTPMITYEDSPVFTLMENEVLAAFRKRVFGSTNGDGVITDGGSMANQMAIALARHRRNAQIKLGGILAAKKRFVIYISEDGHYSTRKGAILQGFGGNNTIDIEANSIAQMDVKLLEEQVQKDNNDPNTEPFMVVITAGTTIFGGIDNMNAIVDICEKYHLWCHVDGMFGGFTIMSDEYKIRLKGVERVDSFGADLHKMMGSTYVMTVLITKQSGVFKDTFGTDDPQEFYTPANPLYQKHVHDIGDHHLQVDKRNNLFKFWFLWKAKGRIGMGNHIDKVIENSAYLVKKLHERNGFQPMIENFEVTNICFLYIPPSMRDLDQSSEEFREQIGSASFKIEIALTKAGVMNIVAQSRHSARGDTVRFLKFVMMGSALYTADIDHLLDAVEHYGKNLKPMSKTEKMSFMEMEVIHEERYDPFGNQPRSWNRV